jgi:hypothetical protein
MHGWHASFDLNCMRQLFSACLKPSQITFICVIVNSKQVTEANGLYCGKSKRGNDAWQTLVVCDEFMLHGLDLEQSCHVLFWFEFKFKYVLARKNGSASLQAPSPPTVSEYRVKNFRLVLTLKTDKSIGHISETGENQIEHLELAS